MKNANTGHVYITCRSLQIQLFCGEKETTTAVTDPTNRHTTASQSYTINSLAEQTIISFPAISWLHHLNQCGLAWWIKLSAHGQKRMVYRLLVVTLSSSVVAGDDKYYGSETKQQGVVRSLYSRQSRQTAWLFVAFILGSCGKLDGLTIY